MAYLLEVTEVYRADGREVETLIEKAKKQFGCEVIKHNCVHKTRKEKKEIVDEWDRVVITKRFNVEKEPEVEVSVNYAFGKSSNFEEDNEDEE